MCNILIGGVGGYWVHVVAGFWRAGVLGEGRGIFQSVRERVQRDTARQGGVFLLGGVRQLGN